MKGLEQAINNYKKIEDDASVISNEDHKEMMNLFLYGDLKLIRHRSSTIALIRTYLESFLHDEGHNLKDLFDLCQSYGRVHPQYERYAHTIRIKGNNAVHGGWKYMDEYAKSKEVKSMSKAVNSFIPFRQYLESELANLNAI